MRRLKLLLFLLLPLIRGDTSTPNTGDQVQAFTFGFTTSNLILPITYTCPTPLTLTQLTTTNAATSDPVAPYTMVMLVHEQLVDGADMHYERIYSASLNVGDLSKTQSISHPWGNGTQFIACIWGSNGASGGCQDLMTVVPSADLTAQAYQNTSSTCRTPSVLGSWVTPTNQTLDVDVTGATGGVSWNAWPGACTDLKFTPKNGTAPYTLLIAPAAHPPVNITSGSASDNSMNYTVRLTHGQAFMAAMYDSAGNSWAFGPLHAGANDDLSCLAVATGQKEQKAKSGGFGTGEFVGGIVGAFVVGALGAMILAWGFGRKRKPKRTASAEDLYANPRPASYRNNSGSIYGKPIVDSPQLDFDTPATLYDPHVAGPQAPYPKPSQHTPPGSARDRLFPQPPIGGGSGSDTQRLYDPYDSNAGNYRDDIGLADFHPSPPGRPRSIASGRSVSAREGSPQAQGHQHVTSYSSLRSDNHSPIRDSNPHHNSGSNMPSANSRHSLATMRMPSSPREESFHNLERAGSPASPSGSAARLSRNVYVVHSDGGAGDVHIQLPDGGANVIELPPNYRQAPSPPPQNRGMPSPRLPEGAEERRISSPFPGRDSPRLSLPYAQLEPTRSRGSGISNSESFANEEELRARAEAAMKEKDRVLGLS